MWIFGILLFIAGGAFLAAYRAQQHKLADMEGMETSTVETLQSLARSMTESVGQGSLIYQAEVRGTAVCPTPLTSELKEEPCIYYSMSVEREYEEVYYERDENGNRDRRTRKGSEVVAKNERAVPFWIDDATGKIKVIPDGAEMVAEKNLSRFESVQGRTGGVLQIGSLTLELPMSLQEGDRRTIGYAFTEHTIPVDREVFVLGEVTEWQGELRLQKPHQKGRFIISIKSEEQLMHESKTKMKWYLWSAIGSGILGLALLIFGLLRR